MDPVEEITSTCVMDGTVMLKRLSSLTGNSKIPHWCSSLPFIAVNLCLEWEYCKLRDRANKTAICCMFLHGIKLVYRISAKFCQLNKKTRPPKHGSLQKTTIALKAPLMNLSERFDLDIPEPDAATMILQCNLPVGFLP